MRLTKRNILNIKAKRIILKNVRTESGKPLRLSDNMEMFKDVEVIRLAD